MTPRPEQTLDVFGVRLSPEVKQKIRDLWKFHSDAEEARNIPKLLSTLTEDCVYKLVEWIDGKPRIWKGHAGAQEFYTALLSAFADIHFRSTSEKVPEKRVVDGVPCIGLIEESLVTGVHVNEWLGVPPNGEPITFRVFIFFPWDFAEKKFKGEVIEILDLYKLFAERNQ